MGFGERERLSVGIVVLNEYKGSMERKDQKDPFAFEEVSNYR